MPVLVSPVAVIVGAAAEPAAAVNVPLITAVPATVNVLPDPTLRPTLVPVPAAANTASTESRSVLILVPQDPARSAALATKLEAEEGWHVAYRGRDEEPENETEVYIMDGGPDYGLCYRLAPVTFLGGSLEGQGCARNPMEAAAMGSAILYGPRAGIYGAAYARLGAARAARMAR